MNKQTINLTTFDTILKEKYRSGDHVLVLCDATEGPFTVDMVDCANAINTTFNFVRKDEVRVFDGAANNVTLSGILGQLIMEEHTQKLSVGSDVALETEGLNWYTA